MPNEEEQKLRFEIARYISGVAADKYTIYLAHAYISTRDEEKRAALWEVAKVDFSPFATAWMVAVVTESNWK